jgi:tetratricopeptide (TPR) repeat protein
MKSFAILGCTVALLSFADIAAAKSAAEVEKIARGTTIKIALQKSRSVGSGVIVHRQGQAYTLVTNRHVVCGGDRCDKTPPGETYTLGLPDGKQIKVKSAAIKLLGTDLDLAAIQFQSNNNYTVAQISANSLKATDTVYTAGFPFKKPSFTFGQGEAMAIASHRLTGDRGGYGIIYDSRTLPGMSGSGVFDREGKLVAIHGLGDRFQKGTDARNYRVGIKTGFNRGISASLLLQGLSKAGIKIGNSLPDAASPSDPSTADEHFITGYNIFLNPGDDVEAGKQLAVKEFTEAVKLNPKYEMAYFMRAITYDQLHEYKSALSDYDRTIEIDPKDADNYYVRAILKIDSPNIRDYKGALVDLDRAIALNPKHANAYDQRATLKEKHLNDNSGALADYTKAIALNPRYAFAYLKRANLKKDLQDYQGSESDYSQAIKIDPKYASAYFNRAGLRRVKLKNRAGAIADYRQAIKFYRAQGDTNLADFANKMLESMGATE